MAGQLLFRISASSEEPYRISWKVRQAVKFVTVMLLVADVNGAPDDRSQSSDRRGLQQLGGYPSKSPPSPRPPAPPPRPSFRPPPRPPSPVKRSPSPPRPPPPVPPSPWPTPRVWSPPPPLPNLMEQFGVRLVGGDNLTFGRLEIRVRNKDTWATEYNQKPAIWLAVKDDGSFRPQYAKIMCGMLGYRYRYGQKMYAEGLSSLASGEPAAPVVMANIRVVESRYGRRSAYRRSLQQKPKAVFFSSHPFPEYVDFYPYAEAYCVYYSGVGNGPFVALKCANTSFEMPPPPPSTPNPPPAPPSMSLRIRLIQAAVEGAEVRTDCSNNPFVCHGRVELLVNSSADGRTGPPVWAPLCVPEGQHIAELGFSRPFVYSTVAHGACGQYKEPPPARKTFTYIISGYRIKDMPIPFGAVPPDGGFDPSTYTHWVTVVGDSQYARPLQEMSLKVSTEPCASGYLMYVQCDFDYWPMNE